MRSGRINRVLRRRRDGKACAEVCRLTAAGSRALVHAHPASPAMDLREKCKQLGENDPCVLSAMKKLNQVRVAIRDTSFPLQLLREAHIGVAQNRDATVCLGLWHG